MDVHRTLRHSPDRYAFATAILQSFNDSTDQQPLLLLPADPVLSRHLARLALPEAGTRAAAGLVLAAHAYSIEAVAAQGRWDEVERHARHGARCVARLRESGGGDKRAMQWRELCLGHAALLASSRCASAPAAVLAANRRALLRQLCEYCHRHADTAATSSPSSLASSSSSPSGPALLRLAVGVASAVPVAMSPAGHPEHSMDTLRALNAALRCAHDERQAGRRAPPLTASCACVSSLANEIAGVFEQLSWRARALHDEAENAVVLVPGQTDWLASPLAKRSKTTVDPSSPPSPPAAADAGPDRVACAATEWEAALMQCGGLVASVVTAAGGSSAHDDALRVIGATLAATGVQEAEEAAANLGGTSSPSVVVPRALGTSIGTGGGSGGAADDTGHRQRRRSLAWALHVQAVCLAHDAIGQATRAAASASATTTTTMTSSSSSSSASTSASPAASSAAAAAAAHGTAMRQLRNAERAAAAACAAATSASRRRPRRRGGDEASAAAALGGEEAVEAARYRRTRATLLLLLSAGGEGAEASEAAALLEAPALDASPVDAGDATTAAIVRACRAERPASLEALQQALALGSADGAAAALPLWNVLAHYDAVAAETGSAAQWDAARRIAEFLLEADFGGGGGGGGGERAGAGAHEYEFESYESALGCSTCISVRARAPSRELSSSSDEAPSWAPRWTAHPTGGVLRPLAARYLHARALLLCGAWAESVSALRQLLEEARSLRPVLRALGLGEAALLRQLGLAMLHDGRAHELLCLLDARGASQCPQLADLVSDALLCDFEPASALAVLDAAAVARAEDGLGAEPPLPMARRRAELRARNNRACLLVCAERYHEAEVELLACVGLAPTEMAPAYNLALLRWQVGERDAAAEGWLRFRRRPLEAAPDVYEAAALRCQPTGLPPPPTEQVSGHVDPLSAAELDRTMLRHWAARRSRKLMQLHWGRAARGLHEPLPSGKGV